MWRRWSFSYPVSAWPVYWAILLWNSNVTRPSGSKNNHRIFLDSIGKTATARSRSALRTLNRSEPISQTRRNITRKSLFKMSSVDCWRSAIWNGTNDMSGIDSGGDSISTAVASCPFFTPTALHIKTQGRSPCDLPWVCGSKTVVLQRSYIILRSTQIHGFPNRP